MNKQFRIKFHQHYDEDGWVSKSYYAIEEFKWGLFWVEVVYYTWYGADKSSHTKQFTSMESAQEFIAEILMPELPLQT